MYTLNADLMASVEGFINKIPDSMVKSHYEKWLSEVTPTERVTAEQAEKFGSYANSLPKELQNFPQTWLQWLKNGETADKREAKEDISEPVDFAHEVNESIAHVPDTTAPDNKEQTLHSLGKKQESKGVKKSISVPASKSKKKGKK